MECNTGEGCKLCEIWGKVWLPYTIDSDNDIIKFEEVIYKVLKRYPCEIYSPEIDCLGIKD